MIAVLKRVLSFSVFILFLMMIPGPVTESHAVTAVSVEHILTQFDGTQFRARQWGDEWMSGWETADGYAVVFDEGSRYWTYARKNARGGLEASSLIVGKDSPGQTPRKLRPSGEALSEFMKRRKAPPSGGGSLMSEPVALPQLGAPLYGTNKIPVILMNFNDTTTTYSVSNFNALLFGTGVNSLNDYYKEISYNALYLSAGRGGIQDWQVAAHTHNYYGEKTCGIPPYRNDCWPATLVEEAVTAVDGSVDFSEYDQDGDCYVDVVAVVHQGNGQEASGNTDDIWSHSWNLDSAAYFNGDSSGVYTTDDSSGSCAHIYINNYIMMAETQPASICNSGSICQSTIGIFAHEYGHALGLPDLYDTDDSSEGIGRYGLMGSGNWLYAPGGDYGDRPAHMSPWSKAVLGWLSPQPVLGTFHDNIAAASDSADVYQILAGTPGGSGEYFLIENRQKSGFDVGLPDSGLAIWHIDEAQANNTAECYPHDSASCSSTHYRVSIEQADGQYHLEKNTNRGDADDLFDSSYPTFDDASSPTAKLFGGTSSGVSISSIGPSSVVMGAILGDGTAILDVDAQRPDKLGTGTVTSSDGHINAFYGAPAQWTYSGGANVQLTATADPGSAFSGWVTSTYCTGSTNPCSFSINLNTFEVALFTCTDSHARSGPLGGPYTYYSAIGTAYTAAGSGDYIECHGEDTTFTENLTFNVNKDITLEGGFDCPYASLVPNTKLTGDLTVSDGSVGIDYFTITGKITVSGSGKVTVIAQTIVQ